MDVESVRHEDGVQGLFFYLVFFLVRAVCTVGPRGVVVARRGWRGVVQRLKGVEPRRRRRGRGGWRKGRRCWERRRSRCLVQLLL